MRFGGAVQPRCAKEIEMTIVGGRRRIYNDID
jgi:hypothetical protein